MGAVRFFADDDFDFAVRCVLNGVRYAMAEPGEVLARCDRIPDGDADAWVREWAEAGRRARRLGDEAAARGHLASAWPAQLRAANYLFCARVFAARSSDPGQAEALWIEHRRAFDAAVASWSTPVEPGAIELGDGRTLPRWLFAPAPGPASGSADGPLPVVVVVNGADAPVSDAVMTGVADAVARGWWALAFDGPGQGAALRRGIEGTDDWVAVLRALLDHLASCPGVDADRVALLGVADGALLAATGLVGEHRPAAFVADPGVVRLDDGHALDAVDLAAITTPTLVCVPDRPQWFTGQSAELLAALGSRATAAPFAAVDGAGLDCEIGAPDQRAAAIFDWLADILGPGPGPRR